MGLKRGQYKGIMKQREKEICQAVDYIQAYLLERGLVLGIDKRKLKEPKICVVDYEAGIACILGRGQKNLES